MNTKAQVLTLADHSDHTRWWRGTIIPAALPAIHSPSFLNIHGSTLDRESGGLSLCSVANKLLYVTVGLSFFLILREEFGIAYVLDYF